MILPERGRNGAYLRAPPRLEEKSLGWLNRTVNIWKVIKHGKSELAQTNMGVFCSTEFMKGLDRNIWGELEYAPSYEGSNVASTARSYCALRLKHWGILFRLYQCRLYQHSHPLSRRSVLQTKTNDGLTLWGGHVHDVTLPSCHSDSLRSVFIGIHKLETLQPTHAAKWWIETLVDP